MEFIDKTKYKVTSAIVKESMQYIKKDPQENLKKFFSLLEKIPTSDSVKVTIQLIRQSLESPDSVYYKYFKKIISQSDLEVSSKIVTNFLYYVLAVGQKKVEDLRAKGEIGGPMTILISPTMRCNLRCAGCYAGEYSKEDDLDTNVVKKIIDEGREIGTYLYTILGGEPLLRTDLFDLFASYDDCVFQVFTNGLLLDEKTINKIIKAKNIVLLFSIEGMEETTDQRRGKGTFSRMTKNIEKLKTAGAIFGYSVTATRENFAEITSQDFLQYMNNSGALYAWYFMYMPVGKQPDLNLMLTPKQRVELGYILKRNREFFPLFTMDFFNDAPYVSGCIAAGRSYIHINHLGEVEPCIFLHYAQDNIKEKSLTEVLNSEFFRAIRDKQPYNDNLLMPCMMIDNPTVWREIHERYQPFIHPTHPGANDILLDEPQMFDIYAKEVQDLTTPIWEKEIKQWYEKNRKHVLEKRRSKMN